MTESDSNLDEYEFDDDFDNLWDDDLGEDNNAIEDHLETKNKENTQEENQPAPSKEKRTKLPFVLFLIAGVGAALYFSFPPSKQDNPVPIVKINQYLDGEPHSEIDTKAPAIQHTKNVQQEKRHSILTPMPEDIDTTILSLPELTPTTLRKINLNSTIERKIIDDKKTLSEDELLSKTEATYKKIEKPAQIIEDTPIKIIAPTVPTTKAKKVKIEQPVVEKIIPPVPTHKKITKKSTGKEPVTNKKTRESISKKTNTLKAMWTIRAAQAGKAVIYDKNNKEMKSVEVNDTIKGIGRIKSIKLQNGLWVIIGTSGKIQQ
ncbi:MAG: hypothetical protein COB14_03035 [Alphaproteobacteria bacterium]|nr:MAG: hypothetical protein COB14_03035 [Alphaproteobacteria bacterium]